ncbi:alginate O-acetyltransferase AlgX-related protein [Roseomonas marmotae]|uniref:Cell division protein FtsQ n=1 Tax=Roseomonas marmotae TaxID=2768161 RepID=A0ABS3KEQ0_9PROT|nr:cell division protein FtsQ [Roseomonas marmotae]MBO1075919.1 cell division protein FtsQ [Roseomonas marmotae]QTI81898.1 cell division protein FtsQ [Roseomonas marmotae]
MRPPASPFLRAALAGQGIALVLLLAWGFWQGVCALARPVAQARIHRTLSLDAFLSGQTAAAVNHAMAQDLPVDRQLRAAGGVFRWMLFRSAGPQVRAGCDEWLYLTDELRPWPDAQAHQVARVDALKRIAGRLASQGIQMLVAVVPDKARVHARDLCGAPWSAQARARYGGFLQALETAGLPHLGLLPALETAGREAPAFYRTDTHWSQHGAAAAAWAIAPVVRRMGIEPAEAFRTSAEAEESHGPGDLLRLMSLDHVPDWLRPAPDRQRREITEPLQPAAPGGGLLDDTPAPPVTLIGSSYSMNANFHGRLQQALGVTVANFAQEGGGFFRAASDYFGGQAFRETPPRMVLWEIPERIIGQPIGPAEQNFLDLWQTGAGH